MRGRRLSPELRDEILDLTGVMSSQGYVSVLVVHPDLQRRGIGARLLDFAEGRVKEATREVSVCASNFNQDVHRIYLRHGYELVSGLEYFVPPVSRNFYIERCFASFELELATG